MNIHYYGTAVLWLLFYPTALAFVSPATRVVLGQQRRHRWGPSLQGATRTNDARTNLSDDSNANKMDNSNASRRHVLQSAVAASLGAAASPSLAASAAVSASPSTTKSSLLADLPMIRFRIPGSGSVSYVGVQVCVQGQEKPVEFMIDTGLTLEMMTPHLRDQLGLKSERTALQGLSAGGTSAGTNLVTWKGASLCDGKDQNLPLPELHAIVTDFPQEHIDPKHDPIEGMLGLEMLSQYDVDLDFPAGRVRLYEPGTARKTIGSKLVEIPAVVINDTGVLGIRLTTGDKQQPVLAILDCGSTFSAVNWKATAFLGLPTSPNDAAYQKGPRLLAVGIDGRPIQLPTISQSLTFAGEARTDAQGQLKGFELPPAPWKPWKPVLLAVGDLPIFPELLGDGRTPYTGPAALVGLDLLGQRRVILESAGQSRTRRRRLFVSPS